VFKHMVRGGRKSEKKKSWGGSSREDQGVRGDRQFKEGEKGKGGEVRELIKLFWGDRVIPVKVRGEEERWVV